MANDRLRKVLNNLSYSLFVNMFSLVVSLLTVLIFPKLMGITDYSYWQLYLFYSSYIVFMSIGWCDGIYLRYGGYEYRNLPKDIFTSQFWSMTIYLFIVTLSGILIIGISDIGYEKKFILIATFICGLFYICRIHFQFILQTTNRIKEYSRLLLIDRIMFCGVLILFIFYGSIGYKGLIVLDLLIKFGTLIYIMIKCKDITFNKFVAFSINLKETINNINVGIKLTVSNLAGILIIGIVRFGIERNWSLETFGKVSFTLSINNMILVCINAMGLVVFPILCRAPVETLPKIYRSIQNMLSAPLLGIIICFYPVKVLLSSWLPSYTDALDYMVLLFPICFFESKMSLILNPYLKALRKESGLLKINVVTVILSVITTIITIFFVDNLFITVISITFLLGFRYFIAQKFLSNLLGVNLKGDMFYEFFMCVIFVALNWFINSWLSVLIYLLIYLVYIFLNKNSILSTVLTIKKFIRSN
ncbi:MULTISPECIES: hypothetical protein [unclassified Paenibacillus]|uniref:lipopolysaccharide biosynthesis protein n=1 Tax=unclassified Paenibacillus TaxID=185978 RepID=UPI002406D9FB|nr:MULTISPECIES: hypothetical protein [unclassified Paenibacillus]MDF9844044.1 O-antigen/teichoic acid export membrane protein [Paenibacillus sp. PastF-2]MDF9850649.1 O-antigen/teichoic acid export membrane protein [Paenibacillus sp. PastM-2]MDF9857200.1 O-antigen/teichoic acid export membrane protein [Paenibacillus sp. PastF-1]MDH6482499.1 O-antigen/teichoic acid export membrane protein [Paenibacillus sp. PastH-2]MDH6509898.1 O-antigen/teichoic acid export membrane protein [Paenibacillus sp. 